MADNVALNAGAGGATISTYDIAGTTPPSTGQVQAVCLFVTAASGTVPAIATKANPIFTQGTDGTNTTPTMDAAARPGFVKLTDGTNTMPTMDAVGRAGIVKITNGTQTMPTMDVAARPGFVTITDATNTMPTMDAAARAGFVKVTDGTNTQPTADAAARALFAKVTDGTNTQPTGDAIARSIFVAPGDVTNAFLSGAAANLSTTTAIHSMLTVQPGNWAVNNQATAGTPTVSKALGSAGVRHVCNAISISVSCGATAQTPVIVNLRDGATGAGTILRTWALSAPINSTAEINEAGLNIVGSAATAMTIEFAGTTAAAVVGSVNMSGFDCV